jgi:hypothetical protein
MWKQTALAILLATGAIFAADPKAADLAQTMMKAMGGQDAWNKAHFVRYDFVVNIGGKTLVDRAHLWDKMTGRYRLEGKDKQGHDTVALFNIGNQQGTAYVNGKKLTGAAAAEALKNAYGAFINDMYWLSMPWKWMDQGVNLAYQGQKPLDGKNYDVVGLTFGKVGLTPGDSYQAFLSPTSHLMEHWEFKLQSGQKGSWDWTYATTGGVKLASNHTTKDGNSINMGDVRVLDSVNEALFMDPLKHIRTK